MFYKKSNERNAKLDKMERDGSTCKRPRGKGKGAASKPKPINKEPGMNEYLMYRATRAYNLFIYLSRRYLCDNLLSISRMFDDIV